jgi:hypothetical protein
MWLSQLNADPLPWLLEEDFDNPGVRYFVLRDLLDRPMDDTGVQAAREAIMARGPVPAILDAQYPEGYWVKAGGGYSPKYRGTVWQIMQLAELGADPTDERVRRGCRYLLEHSMAGNGAFAAGQNPHPRGSIHCLNGNLVTALIQLGFGDDPRVESALTWLVESILGDPPFRYFPQAWGTSGPGFACGINAGLPCAWGANKAMRALLSVPVERRSPAMQRAIDAGVALLLSRDPAVADYPYSEHVSPVWFKLGLPFSYWSDILETADVLVHAGYGADARLAHVLALILQKQDALGRWRLENSLNRKTWADIEKRGKPSKWVTLRALRVLKQVDQTQGS